MFKRTQTSPIGLEICPISIRAAQLRRTQKGLELKEMVLEETSTEGAQENTDLIRQLRELFKRSSFSGRSVISVLRPDQLDIIPIRLTVQENESLEEAIVREARAHLSHDLESAVIDYLPVDHGLPDMDKGTRRILLVAAKREYVEQHLALLRGAGLKPVAVEISACALARVFRLSGHDAGRNILIVNMDEVNTCLTVLCDHEVLLERHVPWGRANLVQCLVNHLKLDPEKSRDLLGRVGLELAVDHIEHRAAEAVREILEPELARLSQEIQRVFIYFAAETRGDLVKEVFALGLCASVRDLHRDLERRIGVPTRLFDPVEALGLDEKRTADLRVNGDGARFGVSLGLALRGFGKVGLHAAPDRTE